MHRHLIDHTSSEQIVKFAELEPETFAQMGIAVIMADGITVRDDDVMEWVSCCGCYQSPSCLYINLLLISLIQTSLVILPLPSSEKWQ
jgi:hypothetical protein